MTGAAPPTVVTTRDPDARLGPSGTLRILVSSGLGVAVGLMTGLSWSTEYGLLLGWMAGAITYLVWVWTTLWRLGPADTARHASRDDTYRPVAFVVVLGAAVASLGAVGLILMNKDSGSAKDLAAGLGVLSVALAWATVHTIYTTRYARIYYTGAERGIDFNETDPPQYTDFAYLAFTIGMTFQVSDTDFSTKAVRRVALVHALLSYLFGAVIIATTINLVAGLSK
ncbi:MAG: hypothetical protein JWP61_175 [Friedmanniella sp.]|nr:hypothetical protein [Friedmanniella sp.]